MGNSRYCETFIPIDILFLSRLIPEQIDHEVRSKADNIMEDAATAWQNSILQGIKNRNGVGLRLLNLLPVQS